jgi:anti-anti-sigma factor
MAAGRRINSCDDLASPRTSAKAVCYALLPVSRIFCVVPEKEAGVYKIRQTESSADKKVFAAGCELPPFRARAKLWPHYSFVALSGELCFASAAKLEEMFGQIATEAPDSVLISLDDLWFIDLVGLRVLECAKRDQAFGLTLTRGPHNVRRLFMLTGADWYFDFAGEGDGAVAH